MTRTRSQVVARKIERLRTGARPRVLDIFSGCGGLSLGFVTAGCESVGGIEADTDAARSFAFNLHRDDPEGHSATRHAEETTARLLAGMTGDPVETAVDLVVGGPPCPTFSRIGKAKINSLKQLGFFENDQRGELYERFIDHVEELQPLAVLMENVPEFLNHGKENFGFLAARRLHEMGYVPAYSLLNAAAYGVPQWRERFFLLALHEELGIANPGFPLPRFDTSSMPAGMDINRKAALSRVNTRDSPGQGQMFKSNNWWLPSPRAESILPTPVTAKDALGDLPEYRQNREPMFTRTNRYWESTGSVSYTRKADSAYARLMRNWPGLKVVDGIPAHHHLTRHTTFESGRDVNIFRLMEPGDEFPRALQIAEENYARLCQAKARERGQNLQAEELQAIRKACVPPYDDSKFPNKWWKLRPDEPVRTLTAHLCKDSYSHIHYDSDQARMITVQEAARLQSFPDSFVFRSSMNGAFRQIGNSVPPLLAWNIAAYLLQQIRESTAVRLEVLHPQLGHLKHAEDAGTLSGQDELRTSPLSR